MIGVVGAVETEGADIQNSRSWPDILHLGSKRYLTNILEMTFV
jgi:hypothetical protein